MKLFVVLFAVLALTAADKYSTENDDLDMDELVKNVDEFKSFLDCFIDKIECKPVPAQFKKDMGDAITTTCAKCTDAQKVQMKKFLENTILKYPTEYQVFSKKYDPDSKHLAALQSVLAKI